MKNPGRMRTASSEDTTLSCEDKAYLTKIKLILPQSRRHGRRGLATRPAPRGVWRVTTVRWRGSHGATLLPHPPPTLCHDGTCHSTLHQFPPSYLPPCALIASRAGLDSEARAAREVHGVLGRACPRLLALGSALATLALESHMPTRTRRCVLANQAACGGAGGWHAVLTQRRPVPCGSHHEPRRTGHLSRSEMENSGEAAGVARGETGLIKICGR